MMITEEVLKQASEEDLRLLRIELQGAVADGGPNVETWRRLLRAVQTEAGRRLAATTPPGCCTACGGTARDAGAPETGGLCWDCRGTGHAHPAEEPCPVVP